MERLSIKNFTQFQAEIMGDRNRVKKCIKCIHGLIQGPGMGDEN